MVLGRTCTMLRQTGFLVLLIAIAASAKLLWEDVCTQSDTKGLPFCNMGLPRRARVSDFVKRVDLQSKSEMMVNSAQPFAPLHIPAYQWWSEGLHGPLEPCVCIADNRCKCPTSFPCPSALAAAFNNTLYHLIGSADGREGRAINNLKNKSNAIGDGVSFWSPTINMQRDPRWGRNQEVPGEDPMLTGQYAVNFLRGLQEGEDPDHVQIVACCKHFVANSLEDWKGHTRHNFDANISKADLANYYLPAFRACVMEGKSLGIMCSYNSVNGKPSCANDWLLKTTLRETWGFEGYVTSDCGAIEDIYNQHNYTTDGINATAQSIAAGTDVDCGDVYNKFLSEAVQKGLVTHEQVDRSFSRLVDIQMRLGLFDNNKKAQPYFNYGYNDIDTAAHRALALEAAQQSIVLLKNDNGVLPLKAGRNVAVIGPHTYSTEAFLSNYHGSRCSDGGFSCIQTPLAAITSANVGGTTVGSLGCDVNSKLDNITAAITTASSADAIVLMVGIDVSQEDEGKDRLNTTLPGLQIKLVDHIIALKKPTVLVLVSGGTVSLGPLKDSAPAIVSAAYGGERAAEAIASVLFGVYNPSGKLAATMYPPEYVDEIPLTEMGLQVPPGRTHMFYTGQAEFPFGHGLSYTMWGLGWANKSGPSQSHPEPLRLHTTASRELDSVGKNLKFDIIVSNLGDQMGKQTVLLFLVLPKSTQNGKRVPLRQKLLAYESAQDVLPGQQQALRFQVDMLRLATANADGNTVVTSGEYSLLFWDGQNALRHTIIIHGPPVVVTRFPEGGEEEEVSQTATVS